jgi:hypothetical protein
LQRAASRLKIIALDLEVGMWGFMPLLFNLLHDHFVSDLARADSKISAGPKGAAPNLPAQRSEFHEQLAGCLTLDPLEQVTDRNTRRRGHKKVKVTTGYVTLDNFNIVGVADFPDQLPQPDGDFTP